MCPLAIHAQAPLRFRTESSLVLINASVFDKSGRLVTSLERESFRVFDEKHEMPIRQVYLEDGPLSTVILLDMSRSMEPSITHVREALRRFVTAADPKDDFCLVTFNRTVDASCRFSHDADAVLRDALSFNPNGETAFYDAVIAAIVKARSGTHSRRAVLILSDGEDTASRFAWRDALAHAKESSACLYALASVPADGDSVLNEQRLKELVEMTGGRLFHVRRSAEYPSILDAMDIRRQYMIGYFPPATARRGGWRQVKVQLKQAQDTRDLRVFWRRGYFSPDREFKQ